MDSSERPSAVTTTAVLCLIFGLCCGGQGALITFAPALLKDAAVGMVEDFRPQFSARRDQLERQRENTSSATEAERLDREIAGIDEFLKADHRAMFDSLLPETVVTCCAIEGVTILAISGLMLVAGWGMFGLNPWARKLGIAVAIARIVAEVAFLVMAITVIMPAMAEGLASLQQMMARAGAAGAGQPPVPDLLSAPKLISNLLFSCAWPVIMLLLLNSRAAKDAFGVGRGPTGPISRRITLVP